MEQLANDWHKQARVRLSRLALILNELAPQSHEEEPSGAFREAHSQYLQLNTDMAWRDYCDDPPIKSHYVSG